MAEIVLAAVAAVAIALVVALIHAVMLYLCRRPGPADPDKEGIPIGWRRCDRCGFAQPRVVIICPVCDRRHP